MPKSRDHDAGRWRRLAARVTTAYAIALTASCIVCLLVDWETIPFGMFVSLACLPSLIAHAVMSEMFDCDTVLSDAAYWLLLLPWGWCMVIAFDPESEGIARDVAVFLISILTLSSLMAFIGIVLFRRRALPPFGKRQVEGRLEGNSN